jgi:hypothetical protein
VTKHALSIHLQNFNTKVKVMNQSGSKDLVLTATEARNIHSDIFELLAVIAQLTEIQKKAPETIQFNADGGKF